MKNEIMNRIINYFEENEEIYSEAIEEFDSYNGCLGDDRYYNMDELDELYRDAEPTEILYRAFYGYDDDCWHTDGGGNKIYEAFNPNRAYFYFNGYGNLVSSNYKDYSGKLDEYLIESMSENRYYIDAIDDNDELNALFDELEEAEEG